MTQGRYAKVTRVIVQQFIAGDWRRLPSSVLTDPTRDADWLKYFPMRINIYSDTNMKAGVAENAVQFRAIVELMEGKSKIPYDVAKRQDKEFDSTRKPRSGTRDVTELYQSHGDRQEQAARRGKQ